jgi:hypothetical protein
VTAIPLTLLLAGLALQAGRPEEARATGATRRPREEAFRMVDAYLVSNLQESLGLSDEQFAKLLPLVQRFHRERRSFAERRARTLGELRRSLESGQATEEAVGERLRSLKAIEAEEPEAVRRGLEAIDASLTPLQQAKYRVLEADVERRIRDIVIRMQSGPGGRRRGAPDAAPPGQTP